MFFFPFSTWVDEPNKEGVKGAVGRRGYDLPLIVGAEDRVWKSVSKEVPASFKNPQQRT